MRIVIFGAGGTLGSQITAEMLRRGHTVKVVVRTGSKTGPLRPRTVSVIADVTKPAGVAEAVRGADVVISAIGPGPGQDASVVLDAARGLLGGLRKAGVRRLVVVGGAGSLEVAPGVQLADTPQFPASWRPVADAHRAALEIYREEPELEWTVVAPGGHSLSPGSARATTVPEETNCWSMRRGRAGSPPRITRSRSRTRPRRPVIFDGDSRWRPHDRFGGSRALVLRVP